MTKPQIALVAMGLVALLAFVVWLNIIYIQWLRA